MTLSEIIQKIDANQKEIATYGKFDEAILKKINYKLRLDWNYHSNRMEGGTLTQEETRSVMIGNIDVKGKPFKDVTEMNGHDKIVLDVLKMSKGEIRLSEKRIKEIHTVIMYEENADNKPLIGNWKIQANEIINYQKEKFGFISPSEVPDKIHELLNKINAYLDKFLKGDAKQHPLEVISQFHIDYLTIHPFYDGNGRTARILTNILLMACGYPVIIIKDNVKTSYYKLLADIQVYGGAPDLFYVFIGERILETQQIILNALDGKSIDEEDDFIREIKLLKQKIESNGASKSPSIIYNVFITIEEQIWENFSKTLAHFYELFGDYKIERSVNNRPEIFPTKNVFENHFIVSTKPEEIKIFGHDLYKTDINKIEWYISLFGLKGSSINKKIEINLIVEFNVQHYTIKLSIDYVKLFFTIKKYDDLLLKDVYQEINIALKNYLLTEIKTRTEYD